MASVAETPGPVGVRGLTNHARKQGELLCLYLRCSCQTVGYMLPLVRTDTLTHKMANPWMSVRVFPQTRQHAPNVTDKLGGTWEKMTNYEEKDGHIVHGQDRRRNPSIISPQINDRSSE